MQVEVIVFKIINHEVLFLLLKRTEKRGGFWQPITGGVHEGENLAQAVDRELLEETGITEYIRKINDVHYFEFETGANKVLKEYVFGLEISPNTAVKLSPEHTEIKWCTLKDSLALLKHEDNKTGFKKLFNMLNY